MNLSPSNPTNQIPSLPVKPLDNTATLPVVGLALEACHRVALRATVFN